MKAFSKKRLWLVGGAVTSVGAAAALLAGATFGFFSSAGTASGNNHFTAGTVVVGLDPGGSQVTCTIGPMSPGDSQSSGSNASCVYIIKYTGNVRAYLGLDLAITGAPGTPSVTYGGSAPTAAQGLYDGTSTGLQFTVSDGTNTYFSGVQYTNQAAIPTTLTPTSGAASVADLLMNTTAVTNGAQKTLTVTYNLPTTAGNAYNLATSTMVMTVHAVQADNNPATGCTAGNVCSSGMAWS